MDSNIIEDTLTSFYNGREGQREHKDRLFPTQSSAYVDYKKYKRLQGRCLRAAYYSCIGLEEDSTLNIDKKVILSLGDYTEYMLVDIFNKAGVLVDKNVKFEIDKYHIVGKVDAILNKDDKNIGIEIKSIGSNKYTINEVFGSQWNKPAPKWQNLFQTIIYCYAFKETVPYFLLMYIRRDTGERKTFKIAIEPVKDKIYPVIDDKIDYRFTVNEILERYELLYKFVEKEEIPPREYIPIYDKEKIKDYVSIGFLSKKQAENYNTTPFGDFECKFCGYKNQCNKDSK